MSEHPYPSQQVFALRRKGKHEEALKLARETYEKDSANEWNIGALGWCIYDEVKLQQAGDDASALAEAEKELSKLEIPERETMLKDCVARILGTGPIGKANALSKEGRHHEAVELLRKVARRQEATQSEVEGYGWVLYRKLKDCGEDEHEAAKWCLSEFTQCWRDDLEPNAMLFRNMVIQAKRQVENWGGLVPMIEQLGLHRLKPEEFEDEEPNPDFPPFHDQLLGAVHKCLKLHPAMRENRSGLLQWLEAWKESFGDDEWPQYHLGHIHAWIGGDPDLARELLLKTVQRKPKQWWRWRALAEVLTGELRKSVLSRAVCCSDQEPSYKIPLYTEYADILAAAGETSAAKASLDEAMRLRRLSGEEWNGPLPAWYVDPADQPEVDIHEYALSLSAPADQMLVSDVPSHLGVLIKETKRAGCMLFFCRDLGVRNLRFLPDNMPSADYPAIEARFKDEPEGISEVICWNEAAIPDEWGDLSPAVVDHLNEEKKLASISLPEDAFAPLYFDRWPEARSLQPGEFLSLRLASDSEGRPVVLSWNRAPKTEVAGFLIAVGGVFQSVPNKGFGFIQDPRERIFVPPPVAGTLTAERLYSGWALRTRKRDGSLSWNLLPETANEQ
jgi:tetratricopeptide (TPR) repeat protein